LSNNKKSIRIEPWGKCLEGGWLTSLYFKLLNEFPAKYIKYSTTGCSTAYDK